MLKYGERGVQKAKKSAYVIYEWYLLSCHIRCLCLDDQLQCLTTEGERRLCSWFESQLGFAHWPYWWLRIWKLWGDKSALVSALVAPVETVQDFLIKLGIKPLMHQLEISIFSLYNDLVRLTKIMNNLGKDLKILSFKVILKCLKLVKSFQKKISVKNIWLEINLYKWIFLKTSSTSFTKNVPKFCRLSS